MKRKDVKNLCIAIITMLLADSINRVIQGDKYNFDSFIPFLILFVFIYIIYCIMFNPHEKIKTKENKGKRYKN